MDCVPSYELLFPPPGFCLSPFNFIYVAASKEETFETPELSQGEKETFFWSFIAFVGNKVSTYQKRLRHRKSERNVPMRLEIYTTFIVRHHPRRCRRCIFWSSSRFASLISNPIYWGFRHQSIMPSRTSTPLIPIISLPARRSVAWSKAKALEEPLRWIKDCERLINYKLMQMPTLCAVPLIHLSVLLNI